MITINMTHVSLSIENLQSSALEELDIELNLDDCEIEIGELSLSESITSNLVESFEEDCDTLVEDPEDPRSVAQATADGVGERLIYPH